MDPQDVEFLGETVPVLQSWLAAAPADPPKKVFSVACRWSVASVQADRLAGAGLRSAPLQHAVDWLRAQEGLVAEPWFVQARVDEIDGESVFVIVVSAGYAE